MHTILECFALFYIYISYICIATAPLKTKNMLHVYCHLSLWYATITKMSNHARALTFDKFRNYPVIINCQISSMIVATLTHSKMLDIVRSLFEYAFLWIKMIAFWFKFHRSSMALQRMTSQTKPIMRLGFPCYNLVNNNGVWFPNTLNPFQN